MADRAVAWARIGWEDGNGKVEPGDQVEFDVDTPEREANFQALQRMGYITTEDPGPSQPEG